MKRKKYLLFILIICTILLGGLLMNHITTTIAAHKTYRPLTGVNVVLDAGHGGTISYPHILKRQYEN